MSGIGKILIFFGLMSIMIGALLIFAGKMPWIGKLPGDMYVKKGNFHFYFPITTSLLLSIILSLILLFIGRRR